MITTLLWLSLLSVSSVLMDAVLISTNRGQLEGYTSYAAGTDNPAHVFKGVPFARAPLGELRFRLSGRASTMEWDFERYTVFSGLHEQFHKNEFAAEAHQRGLPAFGVKAKHKLRFQDQRTTPCPVITYIHGGAFTFDSAVMFNDSQIIRKYASHEIVFVIPAFRLGVFGFLDLGNDETVRRNIGIYDIIQSLKWIKEEIGNFGGDPDRITVMGNSAGASGVVFLLLSPMVPEDYFHQAISLSNTPNMLTDWNIRLSSAIVKQSGCKTPDVNDMEIVDCLRNMPASDLLALQRELEVPGSLTYEGPTPDSHVLPGQYRDLLRTSAPKPMILGLTKTEFSSEGKDNYADVFCDAYCTFFGYHMKQTRDECKRYYKNETGKYTGEFSLEAEAIHALNFGDASVWAAKGVHVFLTTFNLENHTQHAGDMVFAMGLHYVEETTFAEKLMDQYYPSILRNFVKNGRPGNVPHYVNSYFYPEHVHFWLTRLSSIDENAKESLACSSKSDL